MDLEKLRRDWDEDESLRGLAFESVEDLADHLVKVHRAMMRGEMGPMGYLYRKQVERARVTDGSRGTV